MSVKIITIGEEVFGANEAKAAENKALLDEHRIFTVNVLSSPGAGKTSTISTAIDSLKGRFRIGVIEGDVASAVDAEKIAAAATSTRGWYERRSTACPSTRWISSSSRTSAT